MKPSRLEDLETLRGMLAAVSSDLTTISVEEKEVHRELNIARIHVKQAIQALNFFLKDKPVTEPVVTPEEASAFITELNSGTDS